MPDSSIAITAGAGTLVDTRTNQAGEHRQVMVIGGETVEACARVTDPAVIAGAAPSGGSQGPALNVNPNAIQKATYFVARGPASGTAGAALVTVANTDKVMLAGYHAASATTTKRIRRIVIGAWIGTAVNYMYAVYKMNGTTPLGGTAVASRPAVEGDPASSLTWNYNTTSLTDTIVINNSLVDITQAGTTTGHQSVVLYDWQESGETKPITIRAGVAEGIAITVRTTGTAGPDPIITVTYTEE